MALGITISSGNGSGEEFADIVKYDARSGRAFRVDRIKDANGFSNNPVDITRNMKGVFDFENLEVGYCEFGAGVAPVFAMVLHGSPLPAKPTPTARQGVRVTMMLTKECGGEQPVREMAGNSASFLRGIDALHNDYEASRDEHSGKLPVVALKETIPVTSGTGEKKSTNYQPIFEIVGWVQRPEKLVPKPKGPTPTVASRDPAPRNSPPSTGATLAPAPVKQAEPAMVGSDEDWG